MTENSTPFVSVIVAAYNAEKTIRRCLESLQRLDYPDYEIIVVDNNSTDRTASIVKEFSVKYLFESNKGWPAARNTGIRSATAKFVANIDSDCFAEPGWLSGLMQKLLSDESIGGVVGRTRVEPGRTLAEQYYAESDPFNIEHQLNKELVPWGGGNNVYRKEVFEQAGYYDSANFTSGASIEFHQRMKEQSNYKMSYTPDAIIFHVPRGSVKEFFDVGFKYTYDGVLRAKQYPSLENYYSWFILRRLKRIIIHILGTSYRTGKLVIGKETKLRTVTGLFSSVSEIGGVCGYVKANIHSAQPGCPNNTQHKATN